MSSHVMLYIGAGYDLSPLLTFAPGGPPYPILPVDGVAGTGTESYTSFLFVDAKPRHTSTFMVEDFDEWMTIQARVKNVLYYAQGKLSRWRIINHDLVLFEGGGDHAHLANCQIDPSWNILDHSDHDQPLTTLLYAFNTLDIELASIPALASVFPLIDAVYIHGLHPHPRTGLAGLVRLRRAYVIGGSWEGVRAVDFLRGAGDPSQDKLHLSIPHVLDDSDSNDESSSPLVFRRPTRRAHSLSSRPSLSSGISDIDVDDLDTDDDVRPPPWEDAHKIGRVERLRVLADVFGTDMAHSRPVASTSAIRLASTSRPSFHLESDSEQAGTTSPSRASVSASKSRSQFQPRPSEFPSSPRDYDLEPPLSAPTSGLTTAGSASPKFSALLTPPPRHHPHSFKDLQRHLPAPDTSPNSSHPARARTIIHIPIPQLAWSDSTNGGRGGYCVVRTVEEGMRLAKARGQRTWHGGIEQWHEHRAPCACPVCVKGGRKAGKRVLGDIFRAKARGPPRRPRTAPPRLRLRPRAAATPPPMSRAHSRTTSTPDYAPEHSDASLNSASETEVSEEERPDVPGDDSNVTGDPTKEQATVQRAPGLWRRRWNMPGASAPKSLFGVPILRPRRRRQRPIDDTPASPRSRERRIGISDFLSTPSPVRTHSHPYDTHYHETRPFTFPRSPYGPLSLDETRSCPNLKRGERRTRSTGVVPRSPPGGSGTAEGRRLPSIPGFPLSLGRKSIIRAPVSAPPPADSSTSSPLVAPDEDWNFLRWLLGTQGRIRRDRMGMDSTESDRTRVGD